MLRVTQKDLEVATLSTYGYEPDHAPHHVWVDHFDETHSYVRATFTSEFCTTCARKLMKLVAALRIMDGGDPQITVVIYIGGDGDELGPARQAFIRNRLAGFKP